VLLFVLGVYSVSDCSSSSKVGDICTVAAADLIPTQFALGYAEVECKTTLLNEMTSSEVVKYLSDPKRFIPIVSGYNGFYMTDGHHLVRSVIDADIDDSVKVMYCNVTEEWSQLAEEIFFQVMIENKCVWLYDEKGVQPIPPEYFPPTESLLNDPFRSLAWMVRNNGGYAKSPIYFSDFMWGNYFRANLQLNNTQSTVVLVNNTQQTSWTWCEVRPYSPECFPNLDEALNQALPVALELAADPAASNLPGYGQGTVTPADCGTSSKYLY